MDQNLCNKVYSEKSLSLKSGHNLAKECAIIDIGGGDSRLVDHLISSGFKDVTVLDISEVSINKLKIRLGATQIQQYLALTNTLPNPWGSTQNFVYCLLRKR